jgi:hypothetical protein
MRSLNVSQLRGTELSGQQIIAKNSSYILHLTIRFKCQHLQVWISNVMRRLHYSAGMTSIYDEHARHTYSSYLNYKRTSRMYDEHVRRRHCSSYMRVTPAL